MRLLKPPTALDLTPSEFKVFLAGSIEQGRAEPWQDNIIEALQALPVTLLNPRRDAWDSSWEQSIHNPLFKEQVEWELSAQEQADLIAMYFAPNTYSPITLLELGLFAHSSKIILCCPDGFWRKGNVDIVCQRYGIEQVIDLDVMIERIKSSLAH